MISPLTVVTVVESRSWRRVKTLDRSIGRSTGQSVHFEVLGLGIPVRADWPVNGRNQFEFYAPPVFLYRGSAPADNHHASFILGAARLVKGAARFLAVAGTRPLRLPPGGGNGKEGVKLPCCHRQLLACHVSIRSLRVRSGLLLGATRNPAFPFSQTCQPDFSLSRQRPCIACPADLHYPSKTDLRCRFLLTAAKINARPRS